MKFKFQTTITFINNKTKEQQTESFYSGTYDLNTISASELNDLVLREKAYWTFYIEKIGGHKIFDMTTCIMSEFALQTISNIKQFIKGIGNQIQEYYDHQFKIEVEEYKSQKFKKILEKEYKEDLDYIYSALSMIQSLMEDRL